MLWPPGARGAHRMLGALKRPLPEVSAIVMFPYQFSELEVLESIIRK
jgi:hypothetical protein